MMRQINLYAPSTKRNPFPGSCQLELDSGWEGEGEGEVSGFPAYEYVFHASLLAFMDV